MFHFPSIILIVRCQQSQEDSFCKEVSRIWMNRRFAFKYFTVHSFLSVWHASKIKSFSCNSLAWQTCLFSISASGWSWWRHVDTPERPSASLPLRCLLSVFSSPLDVQYVARSSHHRPVRLNIMHQKIKEPTPCRAESIQNAITAPWQQMKTHRPLDGGHCRFTRLLQVWLAEKLRRAAMATEWSYAERGCWRQQRHMVRVVIFPLSYRKLDSDKDST